MNELPPTQVVVLGAGPGGYAAAFMAADLGLTVALVDVEANPGGVCLYKGCIPSKALLHVAKLLEETRESAAWGVTFQRPEIDLARMRAWKDGVIAKMTGGLGQLSKARNIRYIQGRASFLDSNTLKIARPDGAEDRLPYDHCVLAAGSRPATLPHIALDSPRMMNSTSALALSDIPKTLLVVGAGYIGLEMATVYAALGTKVSVVEMAGALLPGADPDLAGILARRLTPRLHQIMLSTTVKEMTDVEGGISVLFAGAAEGVTVAEPEQVFEKVLVAVGRKPNSSGLGLDATKVAVDKRGFVRIDAQCRTTDPSIFAIGDIAGDPMLAHKASHEGRVAAEVIAGHNVIFEPNAIPAVVFTDPEIAWCGLTELEAQKSGLSVKVVRFPWGASSRAATLDRAEGVTKLIIDPETERILGVGIAGAGAGELIAEGVLAMEMGANASDLKLSIHPHPTLSETMMEAAEVFFGQSTHVYRPKK
jgi:dihydrolipoamide dehydrogenase